MAVPEFGCADLAADVGVVDELDPLLLEDAHPAVDDRLLELGVRHAEAHQAAGSLVALVYRDVVTAAVELGGHSEPGGTGAHHRDRLATAPRRRLRHDPPLLERALGDRHLDLLDRDRIVIDRQHACRLARRRADPARELREVVGHVELVDRLAPLAPVDEIVPVRDQVAERASFVTERDAAIHAASTLARQFLLWLEAEVLLVVAHALARVALVEADPVDLEECA